MYVSPRNFGVCIDNVDINNSYLAFSCDYSLSFIQL